MLTLLLIVLKGFEPILDRFEGGGIT